MSMEHIKRFDLLMVILAVAATLCGLLFVFSATVSIGPLKFMLVQSGAFLLGLFVMYAMTLLDYEDIAALYPFIAGAAVVLLVLVLFIGTGATEAGARRWIRFLGIGIQVSEIAKVLFIITLAKHLYYIGGDINYIKNIAGLLLHLCVPVALVILQPDAGTALAFVFIFVVMLFIAGIDWRYVAAGLAGIGVCSVLAWNFVLAEFQKARIYAFINPEMDPLNTGYHVMTSKLAIGSGMLRGKGLFGGIQTQLGILPESQTDFIFAVIGEEAGLIGCILVTALLMALIIRCLVIGRGARVELGTYMCVGVAAMWLFHTFENIGMTIGLMPVTGIPLPFVSYGGSSLVTNFMALGLVLNVRMRKKTINF